jgi:hypothetical protein
MTGVGGREEGGSLGSCLVNGFLSLGDFTVVWDYSEGRGEVVFFNCCKVTFNSIMYSLSIVGFVISDF